jgi:hypothetical protein
MVPQKCDDAITVIALTLGHVTDTPNTLGHPNGDVGTTTPTGEHYRLHRQYPRQTPMVPGDRVYSIVGFKWSVVLRSVDSRWRLITIVDWSEWKRPDVHPPGNALSYAEFHQLEGRLRFGVCRFERPRLIHRRSVRGQNHCKLDHQKGIIKYWWTPIDI